MWLALGLVVACAPRQTMEPQKTAEPVAVVVQESSAGVVAELPPEGLFRETAYSRLLVKERGSQRSLYFVRDSGETVLETTVDLQHPEQLVVPYTRAMMVAPLFRPEAQRSLLIGLGGGAMVHFIHAHWPEQIIDAVEIDPVIVELAQTHFGLEQSNEVRLHAADGFLFIEESKERYDIIYMDAFLKPSVDTDSTGVPLRLKTLTFYEQLKDRLEEEGVILFNINLHGGLESDLALIHEAFSHVWTLRVPKRGNLIAVASLRPYKLEEITMMAAQLDQKQALPFSVQEWSKLLHRWDPPEVE